MTVEFICGCKTNEILNRENIKTMDFVTYDEEGFLVCALHNSRRKGWRSVPRHNVDNGEGNPLRVKKSYFAYSPLEREAHVVFGEPFPEYTGTFGSRTT